MFKPIFYAADKERKGGFWECALINPWNFYALSGDKINKIYDTTPTKSEELQKGDIMVFQPPKPEQLHGHIQMWDGEKWGSDFRQPANNFWPGPSYRSERPAYEFFRYFMVLTFILIGLVNAQNHNIDNAKDMLNTLYESTVFSSIFFDYRDKNVTSEYFTFEMVNLLYLEGKCQIKTGEICKLNWDFLCVCQDNSDMFSVTFETISIEPIQILAKITDIGNRSEILFNFIEEGERLKISDLIIDGVGSLKRILQMPFIENHDNENRDK
jgi:hypothetical protein